MAMVKAMSGSMRGELLRCSAGIVLQWALITSSILVHEEEQGALGGLLFKGLTFLLFARGLSNMLEKLDQIPDKQSAVIFYRRLGDLFAAIIGGDVLASRINPGAGVFLATMLCAWLMFQVIRLALLSKCQRNINWLYYV